MKEKYTVIYINIDGFARYYFDSYKKIKKKELFLEKFLNQGIFFNNIRNVLPSITNPCQNMILSGSTSTITKNVYRYYDKKFNIVVQQARENKVKLLSELAVEKGLKVVSVAHFLTEKDLTNNDPTKLYIKDDNTLGQIYNYEPRFNQLIKVLKKEPVKVNDKEIIINEYPDLIMLYVDDLDGLGHNFVSTYNSVVALNEEERILNVLNTLEGIDKKIEEVIKTLKEENLYDKTQVYITTDHGMTPYGAINTNKQDKYSLSKINELFSAIKSYDNDLKIEFLAPNESPKEDTNLIVVGANLNIQLTFIKSVNDKYLENLKKHLINFYFVGKVKTKNELQTEEKYWTYAADIIISPSERYYFGKNPNTQVSVRGQHDSMLDSSNHVVGWVFGAGINKTGINNDIVYNYDFGTTIGYVLNLNMNYANGQVLNIFKKELK